MAVPAPALGQWSKASSSHGHLSACALQDASRRCGAKWAISSRVALSSGLDGMQSLLVAKIDAMRIVRLFVL
jgi:hypothetical protein